MNIFLSLIVIAASFITNGTGAGSTLPTGTILHTRLDETVGTADAHVGERFTFRIVEPYPQGISGLAGAHVSAHITGITRPGKGQRARIAFVFSHIILARGTQPIAAYVDDAAFTRREPGDFSPRETDAAFAAEPNRLPTLGGRLQNPTLVNVPIGAKAPPRPTGAYAYAERGGVELMLPADHAYNLELARGLTLP